MHCHINKIICCLLVSSIRLDEDAIFNPEVMRSNPGCAPIIITTSGNQHVLDSNIDMLLKIFRNLFYKLYLLLNQ